MTAMESLMSLGGELIRIAFGSPCVVCEHDLPVRRRVASCCVECWRHLPGLERARCAQCALPVPAAAPRERVVCLRCQNEPLRLDWIDSWGRYDSGLTKVLHAFKYGGQTFLSGPLSDLLAGVLFARGTTAFDVIAPVPMHRAKLRQRGYNQAELLARGLSRTMRIDFDDGLLRKGEERRTQSELKKAERRANVRGTFHVIGRVEGKRILLVDDICTTGETLSACGDVLRVNGALAVSAVTVARTP